MSEISNVQKATRVLRCYDDESNRYDIIKEFALIKDDVISKLASNPRKTVKDLWVKILRRDRGCVSDLEVSINRDPYVCIGCDRYNRILDTDCLGFITDDCITMIRSDVYLFYRFSSNMIFVDDFTGKLLIGWILEYRGDFVNQIYSAYVCNMGTMIVENRDPLLRFPSTDDKADNDVVIDVLGQVLDICLILSDIKFSMMDCDVYITKSEGSEVVVINNIQNPSLSISGYRIVSQTPRSKVIPRPRSCMMYVKSKFIIDSRDQLYRATSHGKETPRSLNCYIIMKKLILRYRAIKSNETVKKLMASMNLGREMSLYKIPLNANLLDDFEEIMS